MTNPATPERIQGRIDIHRQNIKHAENEIMQLENMLGARAMRAQDTQAASGKPTVTNELIEKMVERFLGWKLPDNFSPDGGISFEPLVNEGTAREMKLRPSGTNLFDYAQAKGMVEHMLAEPAPEPVVQWCNVDADGFIHTPDATEIIADSTASYDRIAKLKITIVGKLVNADVISVEGV